MQVSIRTTVGIWLVTASASISINPDRFEPGEDEYLFEQFEILTTKAGVSVREWLSDEQVEAVASALVEEYHDAKAEVAEYRYAA